MQHLGWVTAPSRLLAGLIALAALCAIACQQAAVDGVDHNLERTRYWVDEFARTRGR